MFTNHKKIFFKSLFRATNKSMQFHGTIREPMLWYLEPQEKPSPCFSCNIFFLLLEIGENFTDQCVTNAFVLFANEYPNILGAPNLTNICMHEYI